MYKDKIKINIIGISHDCRNIYEAILGNENAKKHILVHAGIHGREYLTSLLVMRQLEYYLENYDVEEYCGVKYKDLFNTIAFHLIPMANPDGITISEIGVNGIKDKDLKKGIYQCYYNDLEAGYTVDKFEEYLMKWKANGIGVDLNRNFNACWDELNQNLKPSFENYKGVCYNSEPETKALISLVNKYNFISTISYHSSGNLIYWDYKYSLVREESSDIADLISSLTGYLKEKSDSECLGVVSGGFKDWVSSKEDKPIPSITIEVGLENCPLDISEFKDIWNSNYRVLPALAYMFFNK